MFNVMNMNVVEDMSGNVLVVMEKAKLHVVNVLATKNLIVQLAMVQIKFVVQIVVEMEELERSRAAEAESVQVSKALIDKLVQGDKQREGGTKYPAK
jgi:hypothetical protein